MAVNKPTLDFLSSATAFTGDAKAEIPYFSTTYSPTHYSITWNAPNSNGFPDVADAPLPSSPIEINIPDGSATGSITTGVLTVRNECASSEQYAVSVRIANRIDNAPEAALLAFSLRKLSTAYNGAAIRVRRSNDNNVADIGFTTHGDLDTTALKDFVQGFNGRIETWYDQSGSGINLKQSTAPLQPYIVINGVVQRSRGVPSIRFLGTAGSSTDYNVLRLFNSSDVAVDQDVNGHVSAVADLTGGFFLTYIGDNIYNWHGSSTSLFNAYAADEIEYGTAYVDGQYYTVANAAPHPGSDIAVITVNPTLPSSNTKWNNIGRDRTAASLNGYYSELLVFPTAFTAADQKVLECSQLEYYGLRKSFAGPLQNILGTTSNALGSAMPKYGTGTWTQISGPGSTTFGNANSVTSTATVTLAGTYVYRWSVNYNGCPASTAEVTVNYATSKPSPPVVPAAARCGTGTVVITAQAGANETVDWYDAATGGAIIEGGQGTLSFTTPTLAGTTTYYAEARNLTTGFVSETRTAVLINIYQQPAVSIQPAGATEFCAGGSVTLSSVLATPIAGITYAWTPGGATTASISATATGSYTVTVATPDGCHATSDPIAVTSQPRPLTPTTGPVERCLSGPITPMATAGTGEEVDWFSVASGGTVLASGLTYSPEVTSTTTFYAESRNTATGCVSTSRSSVVATVKELPSILLGTMPSVYPTATTASISYTNAANNPTHYSIAWASPNGGLADASNAILAGGVISIDIPSGISPATYTGTLAVSNECGNSTAYPISVTLLAPYINITQPLDNGVLYAGANALLAWQSFGIDAAATVTLAYKQAADVTWTNFPGGTGLNTTGTYNWSLPLLITQGAYQIRVTATSGQQDIANITINKPTMGITEPAMGAVVYPGDIQIKWTQTSFPPGSTVNILYNTTGGSNYQTVASGIVNSGSYLWNDFNLFPGNSYKIGVQWTTNAAVEAYSELFTVAAPTLTITTPQQLDAFFPGDPVTLTWTTLGVSTPVTIEASDNQTDWTSLGTAANNGAGSFTFTLPSDLSLGSLYSIRLAWQAPYGWFYRSNVRDLQIGTPTLNVSPISRVKYTANDITIQWTESGIESGSEVDIQVREHSGGPWASVLPVGSTVLASDLTYTWTLPFGFTAGEYDLRVVLRNNENVYGATGPFTIEHPDITLISPTITATYHTNNTLPITWSQHGLNGRTVSVQYSISGNPWVTIETVNAETGVVNWAVPFTQQVSNEYRVRVIHNSTFTVSDQSFQYFEIKLPVLQVTIPGANETWYIGQQRNISWTSAGLAIGHLLALEISANQSDWISIASSTSNTGSYSWVIPSSLETNLGGIPGEGKVVYIRASSTSLNGITSTSAAFALKSALIGEESGYPITITAPYPYTDSRNTSIYSHEYTGPSDNGKNDVYYKLEIPNCTDAISVTLAASISDGNCIHLLDAELNRIGGTCMSSAECPNQTCFTADNLTVGNTYYLVVQGSTNNVTYTLTVSRAEHTATLPTVTNICPGQTINLSSASGGTYAWKITGTETMLGSLATLSLSSSDAHYSAAIAQGITLEVAKNGCTKTASTTVDVFNQSLVAFSQTTPADKAVDLSSPLTLIWESAGLAATTTYDVYLWPYNSPEPGTPVASNLTQLSYQYTTPLLYDAAYKWKVVANNLCESRSSTAITSFMLRNLPDLRPVITGFTSTASANSLWPVTYRIENIRAVATSGIWYDEVYLSLDNMPGDDIYLGRQLNATALNGNTSYTITSSYNIPATIVSGNYYVVVKSTPITEYDIANNVAISANTVAVDGNPFPDLVVTNISDDFDPSIDPDIVLTGDVRSISYTIKNNGTASVNGIFEDGIYLLPQGSGTPILLLTNRRFVQGNSGSEQNFVLQAGAESTTSVNIQIPQTYTGQARLRVVTDAFNAIAETVNNNNSLQGRLFEIQRAPSPDIVPTEFINLNTIFTSNQNHSVQYKIQNQSSQDVPLAGQWIDRIYLSEYDYFDIDHATLVGQVANSNTAGNLLGANQERSVDGSFFIPYALTGQFYVYVDVNHDRRLSEASYANNILRSLNKVAITQGSNTGVGNDNFANAEFIGPSNEGFGYDTKSLIFDLTNATVEATEEFSEGIHVDHGKSVWYKFITTVPRWVQITLPEAENYQQAGSDIGITIFHEPAIAGLPRVTYPGGFGSDIADFTELTKFGYTGNVCLEPGTYYIRFSARDYVANIPLYARVEFRTAAENSNTIYDYDRQIHAYSFGTVNNETKSVTFNTGCLSIDFKEETMPQMAQTDPPINYRDYSQTVWFTFTTDSYSDALRLKLSGGPGLLTGINRVGMKVYQGNAATTPYASLVPKLAVVLSRPLENSPDPFYDFICDVQPNTTFSVQLFFHNSQNGSFNFSVQDIGTELSVGMNPKAPTTFGTITADDHYGIYAPYTSTLLPNSVVHNNYYACNARIANFSCAQALEGYDVGYILRSGNPVDTFKLALWYTFTITEPASNIFVDYQTISGKTHLAKLFQGDVKQYCEGAGSLTLINESRSGSAYKVNTGLTFAGKCLPPGTYSIQLFGGAVQKDVFGGTSHLGTPTSLRIHIQRQNQHHNFDLATLERIEKINDYNYLQPGKESTKPGDTGYYTTTADVFGCTPTVMPTNIDCYGDTYIGAIYRTFRVGTPGHLTIHDQFKYKLYRGAVTSLPPSGGTLDFEQELHEDCAGFGKGFCLNAGTYTLASLGRTEDVGKTNQSVLQFHDFGRMAYLNPAEAENMGDISATLLAGNAVVSIDTITCETSVYEILGEAPCSPRYNKMTFHEFQLSQPVSISVSINNLQIGEEQPAIRLYRGRASEGLNTLTRLPREYSLDNVDGCKKGSGFIGNVCKPLEAGGWYTIVYYAAGADWNSSTVNKEDGHNIGLEKIITISRATNDVSGSFSKYNRPEKTFDIGTVKWELDATTTSSYPFYAKTYPFPRDTFACATDKEALGSVMEFPTGTNRVVFYSFTLQDRSFIKILLGKMGRSEGLLEAPVKAHLFNYDVKEHADWMNPNGVNHVPPLNKQPNGDSLLRHIEYRNVPAGKYSLVVFIPEGDQYNNTWFETSVYVEKMITPRFDLPNKAYDFGIVTGDGARHYGKVGDVNPLDTNRKPSNDFLTSLTGMLKGEPFPGTTWTQACNIDGRQANDGYIEEYVGNEKAYDYDYSIPENDFAPHRTYRKTLWYTFQVKGGGDVSVWVYNRTPYRGLRGPGSETDPNGTNLQVPFGLWYFEPTAEQRAQHPNIDNYTFDQLVNNGLFKWSNRGRSEDYQNLYLMGFNNSPNCDATPQRLKFSLDPCLGEVVRRYFVIVSSNRNVDINSQVEVAIQHEKDVQLYPGNDLSANAYVINSTGNGGSLEELTAGTFTGPESYLNCATKTEAFETWTVTCGTRTIWWKFQSGVSGKVKVKYSVDGEGDRFNDSQKPDDASNREMVLYRIVDGVPKFVPISALSGGLGEACLNTGTYYLGITGCYYTTRNVRPYITVVPEDGDLCGAPVVVDVSENNKTYTNIVSIDCHTWGDDFGEAGLRYSAVADTITSTHLLRSR